MEIKYLSKFARQYKKLSRKIQSLAERKEQLFRQDPFDPTLKTHKLSGSLDGFYAFSVTASYRILFQFSANNNEVWFYEIGTHDIYD